MSMLRLTVKIQTAKPAVATASSSSCILHFRGALEVPGRHLIGALEVC